MPLNAGANTCAWAVQPDHACHGRSARRPRRDTLRTAYPARRLSTRSVGSSTSHFTSSLIRLKLLATANHSRWLLAMVSCSAMAHSAFFPIRAGDLGMLMGLSACALGSSPSRASSVALTVLMAGGRRSPALQNGAYCLRPSFRPALSFTPTSSRAI
ncbi:hypothetical protein EXIGLDRAFT_290185 [Exidia glandulosa HHB12029]|uniref:Uncharacterized protein n=1 Tax=Exidia glandulosa HHB12029 TaxID=1314781 RepID=A0A165DF39_EXIGL|nr:hypothetical protein EXIGLDRAFT_290185 [Exidia glandulosa HHB12029]